MINMDTIVGTIFFITGMLTIVVLLPFIVLDCLTTGILNFELLFMIFYGFIFCFAGLCFGAEPDKIFNYEKIERSPDW